MEFELFIETMYNTSYYQEEATSHTKGNTCREFEKKKKQKKVKTKQQAKMYALSLFENELIANDKNINTLIIFKQPNDKQQYYIFVFHIFKFIYVYLFLFEQKMQRVRLKDKRI